MVRAAALAAAAAISCAALSAGSANAANFVVTSNSPTGPGSLGEAVGFANADHLSHDTIEIRVSGEITLNGAVGISGDTEIIGPGARQLAIDAHGASRVLILNRSLPIVISGVTLTGGLGNSGVTGGAAILNRDQAPLVLRGVQITDSKFTIGGDHVFGGAVYSTGPLTIENSTFARNIAEQTNASLFALGGAIYTSNGATIRSSTFTGNQALGAQPYGGAVYLGGSGDASTIQNSTFAANLSTNAANLAVDTNSSHTASLLSSVIAYPIGGAACVSYGPPSNLSSLGFNLVSDGSCSLGQPTDRTGDPQLGSLADNGGPTDTMVPASSSPVVDQGASGAATADQRGLPRPSDQPGITDAGDGADIGAVELQAEADGGGDSAAPETTITGGPKKKEKKGKATFSFTSSEAGSGFQCRIDDKGFEPCTSPSGVKVKKGKHTFEVRAIDAAGNVDPTPATQSWKVKKKKKKKK